MAAFRTTGGNVSAAGRRAAERQGQTQPGTDKFPIRNTADLENAKQSFGRSSTPAATRAWINRRARQLGKPPLGGNGNGNGRARNSNGNGRARNGNGRAGNGRNGNGGTTARLSKALERRLDERDFKREKVPSRP